MPATSSPQWVRTHAGELVNLAYAQRLYLDAKSRRWAVTVETADGRQHELTRVYDSEEAAREAFDTLGRQLGALEDPGEPATA